MNTKQIREKILNNWKTKIICFAAAVLLYAFFQFQKFTTVQLTVELDVIAPGNMSVKGGSYVPQHVTVSLRGEKDKLVGITEDNIRTYIDLSAYSTAGTYDFRIYTKPDFKLADIRPLELNVDPEFVTVSIEDEVQRYVSVTPTLSGQVAYGYESGIPTVSPSTIEIRGPRTAVEGMKEIQTQKVDIEGLTKTNTQDVGLLILSSMVSYVDENQTVSVKVPVFPIGASKSFKGLKIESENLDSAFSITSESYTVDISVEGTQLALEKLTAASFAATADCSMVTDVGVIDVPVFIFAPENVSIVSQSVDSITVTVIDNPHKDDLKDTRSKEWELF